MRFAIQLPDGTLKRLSHNTARDSRRHVKKIRRWNYTLLPRKALGDMTVIVVR